MISFSSNQNTFPNLKRLLSGQKVLFIAGITKVLLQYYAGATIKSLDKRV
jgi:hypothetical protein